MVRLLGRFGPKEVPQTFEYRDGVLIAENGEFREVGAPRGPRRRTATPTEGAVSTTTNSNNISNNVAGNMNIHGDHRVVNEIHIHVNPLGHEDVSHIKMEQFKSLFDGSIDEAVGRMQEMMSPDKFQNVIDQAWIGLQNGLYRRYCEEGARGASAAAQDATASNESDTDSEERDPYALLEINGEPIKYDKNRLGLQPTGKPRRRSRKSPYAS